MAVQCEMKIALEARGASQSKEDTLLGLICESRGADKFKAINTKLTTFKPKWIPDEPQTPDIDSLCSADQLLCPFIVVLDQLAASPLSLDPTTDDETTAARSSSVTLQPQ